MNMIAEETTEEVSKTYILDANDRCDSCSAQALVLVKGVGGELLFCNHHYNKNAKALETFAYEIINERDKLIENRLIGEDHA